MLCTESDSRTALGEFPQRAGRLDVTSADEPELKAVLSEVRAAQRCLDGIAIRIGVRSNQLAAEGQSAAAAETMRGDGAVGAREARREAARAEVAAAVTGLDDAVTAGELSGAHVDSIARHAKKLSEQQRAGFDFAALVSRAKGLAPESFDRIARRTVEQALGDHGLGDTLNKRETSEFRHWFDHNTGMGRFSGSLDPERYEMLTNAVDQRTASLAAAGGVEKTRNLAVDALVQLVTSSAVGRHARNRLPSVLVVVDQDTLVNGPHPASLRQTEGGHDVAVASIARLCCDATIRRITLDDSGVPINVGRKHRTATDGQWAAIKTMHASCAWHGCTAPISWCQAHHINEWERGGKTDLSNLIPLCSGHHHQVHEGGWAIKLRPDRTLDIYKPGGGHHTTVRTPMRC